MTAAYGDMGSQQGIRAVSNGYSIGGKMRFYVGSGTPAATFSATEIGDLYLDYTNAILYIASATGTGSWTAYAGLSSMASGATIGGTAVTTGSGSPAGTVTAARIGDLYIDYTNGQIYVASATGTGGWISVGGNVKVALKTASTIGGTAITAGNGTPTVTSSIPARIGDLYVDYAAGKLYVAGGTSAASDYKIVTSA